MSPCSATIGWWTVTSLLPSGNVPSTCTSTIISATPVHDVGAAEQLAAQVHQLGDGAAVADELHHLRADQRDRLGVIQAKPARQPFLREIAGLMERELVELVRCQMHEVTIFSSKIVADERRQKRETARSVWPICFDARAGHAQQRAAVRKRCGGDDEIGATCDRRV